MSNKSDNAILESEASFEQLLGHVAARPMPSTEDVEMARNAVKAEWLAVTRKRKRRRQFVSLAAAASMLLTLALVIRFALTPPVIAVQVAAIEKSYGSITIYVMGEELQEAADLLSISAGQTIITGKESGLALAWGGGGSLRIDANSRVVFLSDSAIELVSGAMYFDSMNRNVELHVRTKYGVIRHLGTQYMGRIDAESLAVSVREGRVSVDGLYFVGVAERRQRLTFIGSAGPNVLNISPHGDAWRWVELTAPQADFDGKTIFEFLQWVARETGLTITFDPPNVEQTAREAVVSGPVDAEPRIALRQRLLSASLTYVIDPKKGEIIIAD